jgi:hypothetical protein
MTSPSRLVLVDADGLLYMAGAAGESRLYHVVYEDSEGNVIPNVYEFKSAQEVKDFAEEMDWTVQDREQVIIPGELSHCLQVAKNKLKEMQRRFGDHMEIYVKGDGTNFRDDVATLHKYKGNRTAIKPYYLEDIRQYLMANWNAIPVNGKEADDQIATRAFEASKPCVICSPDKDLDQIPGDHWNYRTNVEYEVSQYEADFFFWEQCLSGDSADHIKGCWKIGVGKAKDIVEDCIDDSPEDIWDNIVQFYEKSMELPGCPYVGMPAELVALENARLVWMQTESGRLWTPPGAPKEYLEVSLDN